MTSARPLDKAVLWLIGILHKQGYGITSRTVLPMVRQLVKRDSAYGILTVVVATLVAGIIAECAIRLLGIAPSISGQYSHFTRTQFLPFGPKPLSHLTGRGGTGEFDYDLKHNSFGLRDDEHTLKKPKGVFRILGLGDSFTYGVGASFEKTYLYLLEQRLNARAGMHPPVEIIKAGVPRYFPEVERMLLENLGKKFDPDLVVVGFLPNDVIDTYLGLDAVTVDRSGFLLTREAAELGPVGIVLYKYCHLCRLVLSRYVAWRIGKSYGPQWADVYSQAGFHQGDWGKVEDEYQKILSIAKGIGANLLILHIPQRGPWIAMHSYPPRRLEKWARERGVHFLDVLPAMKRAAEAQPLYYPKDGHCTPEGYALIANELLKYLNEKQLVP